MKAFYLTFIILHFLENIQNVSNQWSINISESFNYTDLYNVSETVQISIDQENIIELLDGKIEANKIAFLSTTKSTFSAQAECN